MKSDRTPHEDAPQPPRRRLRLRVAADQSRAMWQYGVAAMPAIAAVAATLFAVDYFAPEIALVHALLVLAGALMAASAGALVLLFWGVRRTSRRLARRDVWLAAAAALLVIVMLSFILWRAGRTTIPENSTDAPSANLTDP